jgi:hypothetical protein
MSGGFANLAGALAAGLLILVVALLVIGTATIVMLRRTEAAVGPRVNLALMVVMATASVGVLAAALPFVVQTGAYALSGGDFGTSELVTFFANLAAIAALTLFWLRRVRSGKSVELK